MNSSDDYDFSPTTNSTLASLFDTSPINLDNSSLIYTAPKQPNQENIPKTNTEPQQRKTSIISAYVVQVWKLVNGKYVALGKHGLAIIASSTLDAFEMILYKDKSNVIMRVKLNSDFHIALRSGDFISFYDNIPTHWLIKFNNSDEFKAVTSSVEKYNVKLTTETNTDKEDVEKHNDSNASSNASTSSENVTKGDILTRIAKMGQSILPSKSLYVEENFETTEDNIRTLQIENRIHESQIAKPIANNLVQQTRINQNMPSGFVISQPIATYDPLNLYVAENRVQNSEIKLNLSQISDKLNQMMTMMSKGGKEDLDTDSTKSKVKVLELRSENLAKEVILLGDENKRMKAIISKQENAINNSERHEQELHLEMAKAQLYEAQISSLKSDITQLTDKAEAQQTEIELLKTDLDECLNENLQLKNVLSEKENELKVLEVKLENMQQNLAQDQESKLNDETRMKDVSNFTAILKDAMNEMYVNIVSNLNHDETNPIVAQNIKSTTMKIIQSFQQMYQPSADD